MTESRPTAPDYFISRAHYPMMVFENLTLFEIQIDGEQIGPRSFGRETHAADDESAESTSGRSRAKPLVILAVMLAGLAYGWRRRRAGAEEMTVESEADEADLATTK